MPARQIFGQMDLKALSVLLLVASIITLASTRVLFADDPGFMAQLLLWSGPRRTVLPEFILKNLGP